MISQWIRLHNNNIYEYKQRQIDTNVRCVDLRLVDLLTSTIKRDHPQTSLNFKLNLELTLYLKCNSSSQLFRKNENLKTCKPYF
jgi:hypothetical protein